MEGRGDAHGPHLLGAPSEGAACSWVPRFPTGYKTVPDKLGSKISPLLLGWSHLPGEGSGWVVLHLKH